MREIGHIGLSVTDLDRSVRFWVDALGLEEVVNQGFEGAVYETVLNLPGARGRVVLLAKPGLELELFEFAHPTPRAPRADQRVSDLGITHFCVEVDDIEQEYERLAALGVEFHCPPVDFGGLAKATYALDPDGNVFELREVTSASANT